MTIQDAFLTWDIPYRPHTVVTEIDYRVKSVLLGALDRAELSERRVHEVCLERYGRDEESVQSFRDMLAGKLRAIRNARNLVKSLPCNWEEGVRAEIYVH